MQVVFEKLIGLYMCVVIGFVLYRKNMINDNFNKSLTKLIINVALPCTIIVSLQREFSASLLNNGLIVLVSSFIIHISSIGIGFLFCKIFKVDKNKIGTIVFSLTFANLAFLGIPVATVIFGESSIFYVAFVNVIFNVLSYTVGLKIISLNYPSYDKVKFDIKSLAKNMPILATVIGFVLFITQIQIPLYFKEGLANLSSLTTPLAMLFIGSVLAKTDIKAVVTNRLVYLVSIVRFIVIPILIKICFSFFIKDKELLDILIILFAMPVASSCVLLASDLEANFEFASALVFVTTLISIVAIPLTVKLL